MSKAPSMPMYWDAYLADTTHLTTEEHGAYLLLLAAMWRRNGAVPDDDRDNARILGLTPAKWRKVKARLLETISGFHIENGTITQEKLQKTWENTQEKIAKNRSNGAKGGRPKSNENKDVAKANGSLSVNPNESIPEPEPEPEPKEEEGKRDTVVSPKKEPGQSLELVPSEQSPKPAKTAKGSRLSNDWKLPRDWGEWAVSEGWNPNAVREEAEKFRDYWISKSGSAATKLDWQATWRNWMRNSKSPKTNGGHHDNRRTEDPALANIARLAGLT